MGRWRDGRDGGGVGEDGGREGELEVEWVIVEVEVEEVVLAVQEVEGCSRDSK